MTIPDALATALSRAAGVCECIGGGCPALTHRPDVNRCFGTIRSRETAHFFTARRFGDRNDPDDIVVLCPLCAESPRKNSERILAPAEDHVT